VEGPPPAGVGVRHAPTHEVLEAQQQKHWYDRLMLLCDGVFAIAITLQAADLRGPPDWSGDLASLRLGDQLDAYAMSFLVISIYWLAHRRFMAMIRVVDPPITVLTLIMLGLVALLPAATRLVSGYYVYPASRMVYGALVVAIGLAMAAFWAYAALIARVVYSEVSIAQRWFQLALIVFTPPFFLLLTFAVPNPGRGEVPLFLAALFLVGWRMRLWVLGRLADRAGPAAPEV
jgi:uncharacterized membrane protein